PYRREHAVGFVGEFVPGSWADDSEYIFGIREAADAPLIGVVSWQRERGYVGYWLDAAHRGRGVMTEALRALVDWVFTHDVDRLRWEALAGNVGSATVAQRVGFRWDVIGPAGYAGRSGRAGENPIGWHAVLRRADLGTVQPREAWPVLSGS
ncbi:MAG TPA: GNAT family N-acetyltransferase, partial [Microcella sp.]|nr:GNAT family N-acetyltransferase [Microcella sp.]